MKKKYHSPKIEAQIIQLEEGIAKSSANISTGGTENHPDRPLIESWGTEDQYQLGEDYIQ